MMFTCPAFRCPRTWRPSRPGRGPRGAGLVLSVMPSPLGPRFVRADGADARPGHGLRERHERDRERFAVAHVRGHRGGGSPRFAPRVAVISGPTFAREVAAGEPTALVVASGDWRWPKPCGIPFPAPPSGSIATRTRWVSKSGERSRTWWRSGRALPRAGPGAQHAGRPDHPGAGGNDAPGARHGQVFPRLCRRLAGLGDWC